MNTKLVTFFALFAILFGCVLCNVEEVESAAIKLHVFGGSTKWWIAVDPRNERYETVDVEVRDAGSLRWVHATLNADWGYFHLASDSVGFQMPLTFRFTAENGQRVVTGAFMNKITPWKVEDTGVQYYVDTPVLTQTLSTHAPTAAPSVAPAEVHTESITEAPTSAPTVAPTSAPTVAPTKAPTPTHAPTQAATPAPTQAATHAPTQAATLAPTKISAQAATSAPPAADLCSVTTPESEPVKVLVPLYVYPGAAWDQVVSVAQSGVKVIAIINPNSGPDANGPDATYVTYIKKLVDAGVEVVGYVHTSWGARDINTVTSEITTYATKYAGVNGIFFDEAAVDASEISYYQQAYNFVLSKHFAHAILNPGAQPDQGYLAVSTNIVIYENYATSLSGTSFASFVTCAPNAASKAGYKYKFSAIIHTASVGDMPNLQASAQQGNGSHLCH